MKFFNLLKKELKELITVQVIAEMLIIVVIFTLMGQVFSGVMQDAFTASEITICDQDNTDYTKDMFQKIVDDGHVVNYVTLESDDYSAEMERLGLENLLVIPKGFTESIENGEFAGVNSITVMKSMAMMDMDAEIDEAVSLIEETVKQSLFENKYNMDESQVELLNNPITVNEITIANGKSANISASMIRAFTSAQGFIVPLVIFVLVLFAAQMIISAISTEKIDKTLETLLSAPVSRMSVLAAKMLAATIVAIINAVVYMLAMGGMMGTMMGGMVTGATNGAQTDMSGLSEAVGSAGAMLELGLVMGPSGYVLLGLQMFLTIMIALATALMLGVLAKDQKSVQTLLLPIMITK